MLKKAILFPVRGDDVIVRNIVGGTLLFFSIFLLPALPLYGYLLRVLDASLSNADSPPAFENWSELTMDGLKAIVITIGYTLVPTVLYVVGVFTYLGSEGSTVESAITLVALFVAVLAALVANYLIPAALANFVQEGKLTAAFDVDAIKEATFTRQYLLRAAVLPFVIGVVAILLIGGFVAVSLGVGILFVPFIYFYLNSCLFYLFGRAFAESVGLEDESIETPASDPLA